MSEYVLALQRHALLAELHGYTHLAATFRALLARELAR